MESISLIKTETARFFGVSLTTLANWRRNGCPENADGTMDPGAVMEWKTLRDFMVPGRSIGPLVRRFARSLGELARRRIRHDQHIEEVNKLPADDIKGGSFGPRSAYKISVCVGLDLRGRFIALPQRVMARLLEEEGDPLAPMVLLCEEILKELTEHEEGEEEKAT